MKPVWLITIFLALTSLATALTVTQQLPQANISYQQGYASINYSNATVAYPGNPGQPALPVYTVWQNLPAATKATYAKATYQGGTKVKLGQPLMPIQKSVPLSQANSWHFTPLTQQNNPTLPSDPIYNIQNGSCDGLSITGISVYTCFYNTKTQTLWMPEQVTLQIDTAPTRTPVSASGYTAGKVAGLLGLKAGRSARDTEPGYLLIAPQNLLASYQLLLEWRRCQGYQVFSQSVEDIATSYPGQDLQEKIRNCVSGYYSQNNVYYVTLAGDTNQIPEREFFAFDCAYGLYLDESDLPADMYYGCLDGTFDANNDGIYGQDDDEPDYWPEVFVSRLSLGSAAEVTSYTSRLLSYERGQIDNYQKAAGFSMELWEGSDSQVCQQYINNQYIYPEYQKTLLYGSSNNVQNAYMLLNDNQNIIQHTGHANYNVLSLQEGYIRHSNIENLQNTWGGLWYSIGCWALAFDYPSIGEHLVNPDTGGMLGFVGNSRYGWGAPGASGFGFSEFYQKQFFKNLFEDNITLLAEANALQKLPFIGYWQQTSVYKWVGYELNAQGDAAFNIMLRNPKSLFATAVQYVQDESPMLKVTVVDENNTPVPSAVVCINQQTSYTNLNGEAEIPNWQDEGISVYKPAYKWLYIPANMVAPQTPYLQLSGSNQLQLAQGQSAYLDLSLINPQEQALEFSLSAQYNSNQLSVSHQPLTETAPGGQTTSLGRLEFTLAPLSTEQLPANSNVYLNLVVSNTQGQQLTSRQVSITVLAPQIKATGLTYNGSMQQGSGGAVRAALTNTGNRQATNITCYFEPLSTGINFAQNSISFSTALNPGQNLDLANAFMLDTALPPDYSASWRLRITSQSFSQTYQYLTTYTICGGNGSWNDSFEQGQLWAGSPVWQQVSTWATNGQYSLSARPAQAGTYVVESPTFVYTPQAQLSFKYRYKMPMYGSDGVSINLNGPAGSERLLFLGSGGALAANTRDPQVYIYNDWADYTLSLEQLLSSALTQGQTFTISLEFTCSQPDSTFNNYAEIPEVGVFFDEFAVAAGYMVEQQDLITPQKITASLNPNPFNPSTTLKLNLPQAGPVDVVLYNIKGQQVAKAFNGKLGAGKQQIPINGYDKTGLSLPSGIYLVKVNAIGYSQYLKAILLK